MIQRKKIIISALFILVLLIIWSLNKFNLNYKILEKQNVSDPDLSQTVKGDLENHDLLPEDFPMYAEMELVNLSKSDSGKGISYIWETKDDAGLVFEFYKSELKIRGWSITSESSVVGSSVLNFEKEGSLGFLAVFKGDGGKTMISVTIKNIK